MEQRWAGTGIHTLIEQSADPVAISLPRVEEKVLYCLRQFLSGGVSVSLSMFLFMLRIIGSSSRVYRGIFVKSTNSNDFK